MTGHVLTFDSYTFSQDLTTTLPPLMLRLLGGWCAERDLLQEKHEMIRVKYFPKHLNFCAQISAEVILHIVWKLTKMSHLDFSILAFYNNFCSFKTNLSGNTVWPQTSSFQKTRQIDFFWHFLIFFVHPKCERSSLRSQWRMRLFLDDFKHCKNV